MNSWMLPLSIPTEFLPVNNYSTKYDRPNFSPALVKDDRLTPGPDPNVNVACSHGSVQWRACQWRRGRRRQVTNKKLTDSDDTMLALGFVLLALLVAPQCRLAHGRYVHDLWAKSATCRLFISRDTGYPPSVFWPQNPLWFVIVRQTAY